MGKNRMFKKLIYAFVYSVSCSLFFGLGTLHPNLAHVTKEMIKIDEHHISINDIVYLSTKNECINLHRKRCKQNLFVLWGPNDYAPFKKK